MVREADWGTYRCHAENKHGEDEERFFLYVKGNNMPFPLFFLCFDV